MERKSVLALDAKELEIGVDHGEIVVVVGDMEGSAEDRLAFRMDPIRGLQTAHCLLSLVLECNAHNKSKFFEGVLRQFQRAMEAEGHEEPPEEIVEPREHKTGEGNPWAKPTEEDHAVRREDETNVHREA